MPPPALVSGPRRNRGFVLDPTPAHSLNSLHTGTKNKNSLTHIALRPIATTIRLGITAIMAYIWAMNNLHHDWRQGAFIDGPEYRHMSDEWRERAQRHEELLVRPSARGNAICEARSPEEAKWIAQRLNLASRLEELSYAFATGKDDGAALRDFVRESLEKAL